MAFRKDKTTAAQTSANVAGSVVTALIEKGELKSVDEVAEAVTDIFSAVFEELSPIVEADNKVFEEAEKSDSGTSSGGGSKSSSRGRKTSGGRKGGSRGGSSSITLEDALSMELSGGAFEGETLGAVLKLSAEECDEDFDYGDGERNGRDYISWLASDKNKNEYTQRRARIIADDEGIDY